MCISSDFHFFFCISFFLHFLCLDNFGPQLLCSDLLPFCDPLFLSLTNHAFLFISSLTMYPCIFCIFSSSLSAFSSVVAKIYLNLYFGLLSYLFCSSLHFFNRLLFILQPSLCVIYSFQPTSFLVVFLFSSYFQFTFFPCVPRCALLFLAVLLLPFPSTPFFSHPFAFYLPLLTLYFTWHFSSFPTYIFLFSVLLSTLLPFLCLLFFSYSFPIASISACI